jgi:LUD domain
MDMQTAFVPSPQFTSLAGPDRLERTKKALEANGFEVVVVDSLAEAKDAVLALIPEGSEVMTNTSRTLDEAGISAVLNESGKYDSIRNKLMAAYGDETKAREMRKLAAAPDFSLGSVHAVTEDGAVMIASMSGSQIGQYPYSAGKVIWVAGSHKIVRDEAEGVRRIHEHSLPLESERAQAAYGIQSAVKKLLTVRGDHAAGRYTLVLVNEHVGF